MDPGTSPSRQLDGKSPKCRAPPRFRAIAPDIVGIPENGLARPAVGGPREGKKVYLPRTHPINTTAPSVNLWRRGKSYFSSIRQAGLLDRRAVINRNRRPTAALLQRYAQVFGGPSKWVELETRGSPCGEMARSGRTDRRAAKEPGAKQPLNRSSRSF